MRNLDNQTILFAIVAVTALAVLLQAIVLLAIYLAIRKAARSLKKEVEDMRSSVMPIVYVTQDILACVAPKIEAAVTDVAAVARGLREQTEVLESSAAEILERVRSQASRLDAMFSGALDAVDRTGSYVAGVVIRPVRQVLGLLAAARAIIESLRASGPALRQTRSPEDEDTFI